MNYQKRYLQRKRILNDLTPDCKINWVKLRNNVSREHLMKQIEIAYDLISQGHEVVVEAKFVSGCRADVLDISTGTIHEVLKSETEKMLKEKIKKYPDYLEIEYVKI